MLDFVPNHTAPDHPWVKTHPDYYIEGNEQALAAAPQITCGSTPTAGLKILAYGRDPNFPAGQTPCSSTMPIPNCRRHGSTN